jgi:hypothetical protein
LTQKLYFFCNITPDFFKMLMEGEEGKKMRGKGMQWKKLAEETTG